MYCCGGLFDFLCCCYVGGGFFIEFLCCCVSMVVDYLCCHGCFLCCCGGGGLFDFFDFLCFCGFLVAEVVVMGFFSTGSGGFHVTEVVVMRGLKGDSEEKINKFMVENEVREIRLYYFIR